MANKLVTVELSKRNLMYLLHMLGRKTPTRSIHKPSSALTIRETGYGNKTSLFVEALDNALVYKDRQPGSHNPQTEAFMVRLEAWLAQDYADHDAPDKIS